METFLSHHGVKGMKWGVRSAETLARYERKHPTGRKVYGPELILAKGSSLYRITNAREAKKTFDPRRPTYATASAEDYVRYGTIAKDLPSLYGSSRLQKLRGPHTMRFEAKKDMKIVSGEAANNYIMSNFGNMTMAEVNRRVKHNLGIQKGMSFFAPDYGMSSRKTDKFISKHANDSVRDVDRLLARTPGKTAEKRRVLLNTTTAGATMGSYGTYQQRNQVINDFRSRKYDAIIDPEDYKSPSVAKNFSVGTGTVNRTAMIIIEPQRSVRLEEVYKTFGKDEHYLPVVKDGKAGEVKIDHNNKMKS